MTMKQIPRPDLRAADQRFSTRRAQYLYLANLGYSLAQIADAYNVSKRAIWQGINAPAVPREQGKLQRYKVQIPTKRH